MPVRNQNWYDLQEGRRYPLDDRGTGVADSGELIRDNIIVDCHIKFPEEYGNYAYVSGITVTGTIVTVVISAAEDEVGNNSRLLCAVSVPKPITIARNYAVTPIAAGVAGWIAFGSGCAENFSGKYSTPKQTAITTRNARAYRHMPVRSLGKYGLPAALQDIVKITASAPVVAEYKDVTISGKAAKAVVLSLRGQFEDTEDQPLKEFLGPCGGRPESGTCAKAAILTVNGIKPDCAGNINIEVGDGLATYLFENCGGMGISFDVGLNQFCPKEEVNPDCTRTDGPPVAGTDLCEPVLADNSSSSNSSSSGSGSGPGGGGSTQSSSSAAVVQCLTLPYCSLLTNSLSEEFVIRAGTFTSAPATPPIACEPLSSSSAPGSGGNSSSSGSSSSGVATIPIPPQNPARNVVQSTSVTGFNILTVKNCATDWAINQRISATFKLGGGLRRNGGVVVNYLTPAQTGRYATFIAALLDLDASQFKLIRYNGTNVVTEFAENFANTSFIYNSDKWYTASITPTVFNNNIALYCTLREFGEEAPAITFEIATPNYGFVAGSAGVMSNQAYTYFSHVTIGA